MPFVAAGPLESAPFPPNLPIPHSTGSLMGEEPEDVVFRPGPWQRQLMLFSSFPLFPSKFVFSAYITFIISLNLLLFECQSNSFYSFQ